MRSLAAVVALALALAWSAAARPSAPEDDRRSVLLAQGKGKDKPDAGDDDEEDRG